MSVGFFSESKVISADTVTKYFFSPLRKLKAKQPFLVMAYTFFGLKK